jgi:transposase
MARSYRPVVRDQEFLLPPNMADWLPSEHLVWFVLDVVSQIDTSSFHASRKRGGAGRAGYDPDMLLGLLLYAYAVGERSSRRIERLCVDHVAFRIACGDDGPDHSTISRFRAEHNDAFVEVFAQVLRVCSNQGMVKVGSIAIDGTKIAANAAKGANRSPVRVKELAREEARRIAEEVTGEAAVTDAVEDHAAKARGGGDDDDLPPGFAASSRRAANIAKALEEIDRQDAEHAEADAADALEVEAFLARVEAGEVVRKRPPPGTDMVRYHQARIARLERILADLAGKRGPGLAGKRQDAKRLLHAALVSLVQAQQEATDGAVDDRGRSRRKRERRDTNARARGGTGRVVNTTDADSRLMTEGSGGGIVQGYNAQFAVTDDHFILALHLSQEANDTGCYQPALDQATLQASALDKTIDLVLADAGYCTEDNLNAEGPDRLIATGKHRDLPDPDPAATIDPDAGPVEQMRQRLADPADRARYKRRSATVETVIAHTKDRIGLRRFARRGLQAAQAELHLAATAINLTRLYNTRPATP